MSRRSTPRRAARPGLAALALALTAWGAGAQPIVVRDDAQRTITLPAPARRVISLAPHATELIFAAGAGRYLVGVDVDSNHPEAARRLPRVGTGLQADAERVLALAPDLLVYWAYGSGTPAGLPDGLPERFGIAVYQSNPRRLADIPDAIERMGELLGTAEQARAAAAPLRQRLAELTARYGGRRPVRVFYQLGTRPMYTVSDRSIIGDALRVCGAVNVFGALPAASPMVDAESVLRTNPQAIVLGQRAGPAADRLLDAWRAFAPALAAAPHELWTVDPDAMHRPGPRLIDATAALCARIDQVRQRR